MPNKNGQRYFHLLAFPQLIYRVWQLGFLQVTQNAGYTKLDSSLGLQTLAVGKQFTG